MQLKQKKKKKKKQHHNVYSLIPSDPEIISDSKHHCRNLRLN